jgi:GH35 family endo-1,4-beta-xylanase
MKMKKQYIILALGAMFMASCADEFDRNFEVSRPELSAEYAYLNDYKALKEYVSDPNFKLGIGTDATDYAKQGPTYVITNVNFTETVAGNAMKMASCVDDNGSMNFGTVEEYVNAAHAAGLNIYGHTLAWHAQQPVKWLNSLIADKPIPVTPGGEQEVQDYYQDLTAFDSFPYYVMGYTPQFSKEEGLISEYPGSWYQYFIATGIAGNADTDYILTCEVKSDKSGDVGVQVRWSWNEEAVSTTLKVVEGDWQEISCKFSGVKGSPYDIIFQPGGFDGRFCIKNIKVSHIENTGGAAATVKYWESVINNGDMEGSDAKSFATKSDQGDIVYTIFDGVGKDGSRGAKISSKGGYSDAWESQFWIVANEAFPEGTKLHVKFDYKADGGCVGTSVDTQAHFGPGEYQHWACAGSPKFTADWQTYDKEFTVDGSMAGANGMKSIAFNMSPNTSAGNYYIDNVTLEVEKEKSASGPVQYMADLVSNGDMEGDDVSCFFTTEPSTGGPHASTIEAGAGKDGSRGIVIQSEDNPSQDWDTQFFLRLPETLPAGTKFHVEFDYRSDIEGGCDTQAHNEPGAYMIWHCIGSPTFKTDWQHFSLDASVEADMDNMRTIAFNLAKNKKKTKFFFDNIVFQVEKESTGGGIPQTAQEKKDTLTYAMDKWIHGMMDACKDDDGNMLVKTWEVANEAIGSNGQLQHGKADDTDNFFWQDYLGDLDYVRTVVKLARQYGGDDLTLFVNDYNLEYDWDASGNKKLESLISWINKWESDGKTKIDGIGSQMHVSCYADPAELAKRKELIINSFKMMAATGKLIRISELDMGYVDANGNAVKTVDMTEAQHHEMADFYKWIIQQYKANIPAAQQWGITLWCATDAPANSGWRPGEPVGIWDQNYYRKHVYAGVADGLSGE